MLLVSLSQQGAAGKQLSDLSPVGVLWRPAGNSWSSLEPQTLLEGLRTEGLVRQASHIHAQAGSTKPSSGYSFSFYAGASFCFIAVTTLQPIRLSRQFCSDQNGANGEAGEGKIRWELEIASAGGDGGVGGVMTSGRKRDPGDMRFATSCNTVSHCASLHPCPPPSPCPERTLHVPPPHPHLLPPPTPAPPTQALSKQLPLEWKVFQSTKPLLSMGALACHQCAVTSRWGAN